MEIQEENLQSGFPELKLLKQVSRVLQKEAHGKSFVRLGEIDSGKPCPVRWFVFCPPPQCIGRYELEETKMTYPPSLVLCKHL